ncbi:Membrane-associated protein VIPP1, chloroplastic [Coccomyxa sp. Obi]|nr:Membrane-associated protein VIPP1, chloroplastic [Coccomyxa sp. Obi]
MMRTNGRSAFLQGTQLARLPARPRNAACGAAGVQMNLFSRLFRVARSYANALVSSVEDPEKMLEQTVNEMQSDLIKMRQASAQVMASQKQIEVKYKQAQQAADEWYRRAQLAVEKGDDELAKEALKRRKSNQENADTMKAQLDQQRKAVDQLISNTKMLESKLVEAKSKKDTLKARAKTAQTSRQIADMVQGLNTSNAVTAFERMEEKVMALEAEAESTLQLGTSDNLESKFRALEGGDVEDELAQLKKGTLTGARSGPQALPEGRPIRDAIDFELEELRRKARE